MKGIPSDIKVFNHLVFPDNRGELKCIYEMNQDKEVNGFSSKLSHSSQNVARGIHWQDFLAPQSKAITVLKGAVLDFLIDLDPDSEFFGKVYSFELDESVKQTILIPPKYGHGFFALKETIFFYNCFGRYSSHNEMTINILDLICNKLNLKHSQLIVSEKDRNSKSFNEHRDYIIKNKSFIEKDL